jgi:pilus assembly protein CpaB
MRIRALIAALATAALGIGLMFVYMRRFEAEVRGGDLVEVLVAVEDIPLGAQISEEMLGFDEVPRKYVQERHIRRNDVQRVLGVRARAEIRANEWVLWTDLATSGDQRRDLSSLLREGMRAVNIGVRRGSAFGGLLRPGDRVDVLLTMEEGGGITLPLLQNVLVLAVGADTGRTVFEDEDDEEDLTSITVALTVEQAQLITLGASRGSMSLTLRNPDDIHVIEDLPDTRINDIVEIERRANLQRRGVGREPATPMVLE